MTIAELHGKLNPERPSGAHERMEDLLTSDVFGTMKYAGWQNGFMNWLRSAISCNGKFYATEFLPEDDLISNVYFAFWPTLSNNREPDLLIGIRTTEDQIVLIMVEAKYFSGASNYDIEPENITPELSGNQIADQINCFPDVFPDISIKATQCLHIYVTAHDILPVNILESASQHIKKGNIPFFWLNWQALSNLLMIVKDEDIGKQEMINDLIKLLKRKDLIPFDGFKTMMTGDWKPLIGKSFLQAQSLWSVQVPHLPQPIGFLMEEL